MSTWFLLYKNRKITCLENQGNEKGLVGTWTAISYIVLISFLY